MRWLVPRSGWTWIAGVFLAVLAAELALIACAGTDIPFYDQWDLEGRWLYPAAQTGHLTWAALLQPENENRIAWTLALDLGLFRLAGQWDPLLQLVAGAALRALAAAGLAGLLGRNLTGRGRLAVALGVTVAFLPFLAWHNVLWAMESQCAFVLGFTLLGLAWLDPAARSRWHRVGGLLAGAAALLAMAPAELLPVPLAGLALLRAWERRRLDRALWSDLWPALALLALALAWRAPAPQHDALRAAQPAEFLAAAGRTLAWPGPASAVLAMQAPLLLAGLGRALRRRPPAAGEDFWLLLGGWSAAVALAIAWARGGGPELSTGVPSRYADFLILLPVANAGILFGLLRTTAARWQRPARLLAVAWGALVLVSWAGLSAEMLQHVILPRARDRAAPVRLAQAFQASRDPAVFAGQPRLYVPHPELSVVAEVLDDPRMRHALPPSLQPDRPLGWPSRAVRWLLGPANPASRRATGPSQAK